MGATLGYALSAFEAMLRQEVGRRRVRAEVSS